HQQYLLKSARCVLAMENGNAFLSGVGRDTLPQDFPAGMRVLVVEDDPNDLEHLTQILERCGYKVTAKASPREALKEVEENGEGFHFDIIMTVVHGGEEGDGFDGFDLLERVRDRYPVIIFSADYSKEMVMRTINEGACDFLPKPMCYQEVRNIWFHVDMQRGLEVDDPDEGVEGASHMFLTDGQPSLLSPPCLAVCGGSIVRDPFLLC
uniref:Response regulatory domain-containing protein n=1 Tax=Aegilops tauschii subsp. strangulata TaxID=200361 RepID=A0A453MSI2_AEGTS